MIIKEIKVNGFRNLKDVKLSPNPAVNVLYGENAQGKTNLLEAIWLCGGSRSFRGAKERDFVGFDRDEAEISVDFKTDYRTGKVEIKLFKGRAARVIKLNGVKLSNFSDLIPGLSYVLFTPEDLELAKGSPDVRREFIDMCITQLKPSYVKIIKDYETNLIQRNAVLKQIGLGTLGIDDLDIWDHQLAHLGAYISMMRYNYTAYVGENAGKIYNEMSRGMEKLTVLYQSTVYESLLNRKDYHDGLLKEYYLRLVNSRKDDIRLGYTQVGVHRDDLIININGVSAKEFGSQGQNRSAALSLKLGIADLIKENKDEMPIILLDDVLSELDKYRREYILKKINGAQLFITCCQPFKKVNGNAYDVVSGQVIKKN